MLLYSPAYVILITLFITLLSLQVSVLRLKHKIPDGDGGNEAVRRAILAYRAMLDFSVVFVPLLLCAELMGVSNRWIAVTSLTFLVGRVAHTSSVLTNAGLDYRREGGKLVSHAASLALMGKLAFIIYSIPS